jgi:hypothetical protein
MWSGEYFGFGEVEILELVESEIALWEGGRFLIFLSFWWWWVDFSIASFVTLGLIFGTTYANY